MSGNQLRMRKGGCNNPVVSQVVQSPGIHWQKKGESHKMKRGEKIASWAIQDRQTHCEGFQQKDNRSRQGIQMHTCSASLP